MIVTPNLLKASFLKSSALLASSNLGTFDLNENLSQSAIGTGILFYCIGMVGLTAWDSIVLPKMGITWHLKYQFTPEEKKASWIDPWMYHGIPPSLDTITSCEKHRVHQSGRICQYISTKKLVDLQRGVSELNDLWSDHYGVTIFIHKAIEK